MSGRKASPGRTGMLAAAVIPLAGSGLYLSSQISTGARLWWVWLLGLAAAALVYDLCARLLPVSALHSGPLLQQTAGWLCPAYGLAVVALFQAELISMWTHWAMPRTPSAVYVITVSLLVAYAVGRGERACRRLALLSIATLFALTAVDSLLLGRQMQLSRVVLPAAADWPAAWAETGRLTLTLLLPLPVLLMERRTSGAAGRFRPIWGLALAGLYLLWAALRNVALLGGLLTLDEYPILRSLRLIELGSGLPRSEYWGVLALFATALVGVMLCAGVVAEQAFAAGHGRKRRCVWTFFCLAGFTLLISCGLLDGGRLMLALSIAALPIAILTMFLSKTNESS